MWYVRAFWRKGREDLVGPGKGADLGGRAGLARDANHVAAAVAELGGGGVGWWRRLRNWAGVQGFGGRLS